MGFQRVGVGLVVSIDERCILFHSQSSNTTSQVVENARDYTGRRCWCDERSILVLWFISLFFAVTNSPARLLSIPSLTDRKIFGGGG